MALASFSVLIVEDQERFRAVFHHALESVPDIQLLGIAADLPQGRQMFDELQPDVLLVDLDLPGGSGIELIRHAAQTRPQCEVMVITIFGDEQNVVASIEAGATGYLLKDSLALDLPGQLRLLRSGGSPISPVIARRLLVRMGPGSPPPVGDDLIPPLSEQELRVLSYAAKGFTFDEVAQFMQLSPHTVTTYIKRVYEKLQVRSKMEAVYEARRLGWIRD